MKNEIKMHNHLGQARYKMNLSEQKIFIYALSKIDQEKKKFNEVEFSIKDLAVATKLNEKTLFRELEKIATNIMKTVIKADRSDGKKGWILYNLTQRCEHLEKEGLIKFKFNEDMKPLLLELKEHYFVQNPVVITFKSWHAIRLYDFVESIAYTNNEYQIEIEELKDILGLTNKYKVWGKFNERVLTPSIDEINSKSDINIDFELVKRGRSAHSVLFKFTKAKDLAKLEYIELAAEYDIENIKTKCGIGNELFTDGEVLELYELAVKQIENTDFDVYEYIKKSYAYMKNQSNIKSRFSYLRDTIKNNWCSINTGQIRFEI